MYSRRKKKHDCLLIMDINQYIINESMIIYPNESQYQNPPVSNLTVEAMRSFCFTAEVQPIHSVGRQLYDSIHVRCCVDVTTASLVGGSPKEFTADFLNILRLEHSKILRCVVHCIFPMKHRRLFDNSSVKRQRRFS